MNLAFLKCDPYNFVPVTRTPWAGELIRENKSKQLKPPHTGWPERIGESWEISTETQFPSRVVNTISRTQASVDFFLSDLLNAEPHFYLGQSIAKEFGAHCPLLLKWLNANEPLSVQVHPNHSHPLLKGHECGKPESWLVLKATPSLGFVFLGFKEGLSKDEIIKALSRDAPKDVMHIVYPDEGDYISIPTGCVHATGPGVLIAEPQYVLPQKTGITWRLSDWGRRYNGRGERDPNGQPRELHLEDAISAIDWNLPRGKELEELLIQKRSANFVFHGNKHNPFPVHCFSSAGKEIYTPLVQDQFSLVTCWEGHLELRSTSMGCKGESLLLHAGESAFVAAEAGKIDLTLRETASGARPQCAFFAFDSTLS